MFAFYFQDICRAREQLIYVFSESQNVCPEVCVNYEVRNTLDLVIYVCIHQLDEVKGIRGIYRLFVFVRLWR